MGRRARTKAYRETDPEGGVWVPRAGWGGAARARCAHFLEVWRNGDGLDGTGHQRWCLPGQGTWSAQRPGDGCGSTAQHGVTIGRLMGLCLDQTQWCCDQRLREGCGHQDLLLRFHREHNEELPHLLPAFRLHLRATRPGEASDGPATVRDGQCQSSQSALCVANQVAPVQQAESLCRDAGCLQWGR